MFSIGTRNNEKSILRGSSFRPLSGIMFSIFETAVEAKIYQAVSVPSRGLCFQSKTMKRKGNNIMTFPSPLGDYVFNHRALRMNVNGIKGFRPLSGIMFSI